MLWMEHKHDRRHQFYLHNLHVANRLAAAFIAFYKTRTINQFDVALQLCLVAGAEATSTCY